MGIINYQEQYIYFEYERVNVEFSWTISYHVAFNVYKVGSSCFWIGVDVENDPKMIRNLFTSGSKDADKKKWFKWYEWTKYMLKSLSARYEKNEGTDQIP